MWKCLFISFRHVFFRHVFRHVFRYVTPKIVYRVNVENDINDEKKFYFGVFETLSVSEITNNDLIMSNTEIAPNCPNTSGS